MFVPLLFCFIALAKNLPTNEQNDLDLAYTSADMRTPGPGPHIEMHLPKKLIISQPKEVLTSLSI
jgi:hypothetical protein